MYQLCRYFVFQSCSCDVELPLHPSSTVGFFDSLWLRQEREGREMLVSCHHLLTSLFPPVLPSLHALLPPSFRALPHTELC